MSRAQPSLPVKWLPHALLLVAAAFLVLHFLHLRADFPNHSPWDDWAKYTDEGWYGDAAIRHYLRGNWHLPGDFNPAAALPVWPLLEALVFRFTGVGIVAARVLAVSVFSFCLLLGYRLLLLPMRRDGQASGAEQRVFAAAAAAVLAVSSFLYAFSRLAIMEPLLNLWMLLALLLAYRVRHVPDRRREVLLTAGLGAVVALMIGTKTTALFLLPAVLYMLWDSAGWRPLQMLRLSLLSGAVAAVAGLAYLALLVRGGFLRDFRYLFSANGYTSITRETFWPVVLEVFGDGMWTGRLLYPLGVLAVAAALLRPRVFRDPVFTALLLWPLGYLAFMAYHANFQPRYYVVVAVPMILLLFRGASHLAAWNALSLYALAPMVLVVLLQEAHHTVGFATHLDYSYLTAAERIERVVESDPAHSHTVLSISGSNLSLMTGLPSICDDFGTMDLEDRIAAYKPGWFVTWNFVEDDKMLALTRFYRLTRVAAFPALDDTDRNQMIVYRLDAREGVQPRRRRPSAKAATQQPQG